MIELPPDADPATRVTVGARYGLEVEPASIPRLCDEHGLTFGREVN